MVRGRLMRETSYYLHCPSIEAVNMAVPGMGSIRYVLCTCVMGQIDTNSRCYWPSSGMLFAE